MARPQTPVGAYGSITVRRRGEQVIAETRIRDADERVRHVRVSARSASRARQVLRGRLLERRLFGSGRTRIRLVVSLPLHVTTALIADPGSRKPNGTRSVPQGEPLAGGAGRSWPARQRGRPRVARGWSNGTR